MNNVLTRVMAVGDAPWFGSLRPQEHHVLTLLFVRGESKARIAIITHPCSVSLALPSSPAPPSLATRGLQPDVADIYFLYQTDCNISSFLFKHERCLAELRWLGAERS